MQSTAGLTIEEEQYYYCNVYLSNNHLMWRLDPIFNLYCLHFNLIIISLLILCFFWLSSGEECSGQFIIIDTISVTVVNGLPFLLPLKVLITAKSQSLFL